MKAIWTEDAAEYHGEFVNFGPMAGVAQAGAETASAVIVGRRIPLRGETGAALREWLDAHCGPPPARRPGPSGANVPPHGGGGRAGPRDLAHHRVRSG